ncbi:Sec-independent protein translocase protein TatB [Porphyridium purpureum]|uniref:Sec-independent protein translocase protein TatB n=1 Tax=Porphyridium purpureum TaxID=35688 RepID=A0A5J4YYP1_PORPP|nr:Sec-independent protein translocase protein TatB [Porphyridium purpureum]|eukprot:POR8301..scf208_2
MGDAVMCFVSAGRPLAVQRAAAWRGEYGASCCEYARRITRTPAGRSAAAHSAATRSRSSTATVTMSLSGGLLGVGPMELAVVFAVGWIVLGPSELVSLARQLGKFIGGLKGTVENVRTNVTQLLESENMVETLSETMRTMQEPIKEIQRESLTFQEQIMRMNDPAQVAPRERQTESTAKTFNSADENTLKDADFGNEKGDVKDDLHRVPAMTSAPPPPKPVLKDLEPAAKENDLAETPAPITHQAQDTELELSEDLDLDELERRYQLRKRQILAEAARTARSTDSK